LLLAGGCSTISGEDPALAANRAADKKFDVWQASHNEKAAEALQPIWNGEQAVRLTYRIDAGQLGAPLAISCVQAQQVAYQEVAPSPLAERSVGVLDIQYPHPAGRAGLALVGVVVQQQDSSRGITPNFVQHALGWFHWPDENTILGSNRDLHEAWVMDVPGSEVAQLIGRLQTAGFYGNTEQRHGHVRISSRIGASFIAKDWTTVSELDGLMHRVRSQGQLVSYQGIALPLEGRPTAPASVVAWRTMHAAGQTTAEPNRQLAGLEAHPPTTALFAAPNRSPKTAPIRQQIARLPETSSLR
jgi:hypothetical protein